MFYGVLAVIVSDEVPGMVEVVHGLPCGFLYRVAGPFDEVLVISSGTPAIQESFHFVFEFVVNDDGFRRSVTGKVSMAGFDNG
jgi:hypothetical protein